jgi:hypothetical protein
VAVVFAKQLREQPVIFKGHNDTNGLLLRLIRPSRHWR